MTREIIILMLISFALGLAVAALVFFIVCRKLIKANDDLVKYLNFCYDSTNKMIDYINGRDGQNFPKLEHFPYISECKVTYESGAHK